MWIRYRLGYGAGPWGRWHETTDTKDGTPAVCGLRCIPYERTEAAQRRPSQGICGACERIKRRAKQRPAKCR